MQTLAKSYPADVGQTSLQVILDLLRDHGTAEEYQECLELLSLLIKNGNETVSKENANHLVSEASNVELLLDLLEHEDGLIGIMASEILRDAHSLAPAKLEQSIQDCPAGMNKLLHRVADRSREEVGNEALVLIQQLTVTNEEMKKTVAFNEVILLYIYRDEKNIILTFSFIFLCLVLIEINILCSKNRDLTFYSISSCKKAGMLTQE